LFFFSHGAAAIASSRSSSHLGLATLLLFLPVFCLWATETKCPLQPPHPQRILLFLKIFKTFAIFLRKKIKKSPDLDNESM
jgi:hypothetical protein